MQLCGEGFLFLHFSLICYLLQLVTFKTLSSISLLSPVHCSLGRCTNIITGEDSSLPRVKPFKYTYEKEIVMYAYFKKLDYFSTECIYAPFAARGFARDFVKDLEVRT